MRKLKVIFSKWQSQDLNSDLFDAKALLFPFYTTWTLRIGITWLNGACQREEKIFIKLPLVMTKSSSLATLLLVFGY